MTALDTLDVSGHFPLGVFTGCERTFQGILAGAEIELAIDQAEALGPKVSRGVGVLGAFTKHDVSLVMG
jgi:hypothetical protein